VSAVPTQPAAAAPSAVASPPDERIAGLARRFRRVWYPRRPSDVALGVLAVYLLIGLLIAHDLWRDPSSRLLSDSPHDQELFEWWIAWGAHALQGLHYPLVSHAMNAPYGVNAMNNTSILLLSFVTAPVTWLWGPGVTFSLLVTVSPALTGFATYVTLRRFRIGRPAAFVGGLLVVLAPGLHSQAEAHIHMAMAVLVPLMIGEVVALATARVTPRVGGIRLGLLAFAQLFVGEEWLLIAGLASLALLCTLAIAYPRRVRAAAGPLARGLAVAGAVAAPLAAVPLAVQLAGPEHVHGSPFNLAVFVADLKSFVTPSKLLVVSSAGARAHALRLDGGITEQNAYLGWTLLGFCAALAAWLRRDRRVWVVLGAATVVFVLALGAHPALDGKPASIRFPWGYVDKLPLLEQALPGRIALMLPLLLAVIVALGVDRGLALRRTRPAITCAVLLGTLATLVSLLPTALATAPAQPAPAAWSSLPRKGSIFTLPEVTSVSSAPMRWDADDGIRHALVGDHALVPDASGQAFLGLLPTPALRSLAVAPGSQLPPLTPELRRALLDDFQRLRVSAAIALPDPMQPAYIALLTALLGPPTTGGPSPIWLLHSSDRQQPQAANPAPPTAATRRCSRPAPGC
jgi:hypothetical protein